MVFVTHDQVEAMTMATRIVVMNHGRIEQVGTPLGIYRRPATRFVAGFIGSPAMNFLKVEPAGVQNGVIAVRLPDGTVIQTDVPGAAMAAAPVELGVRAEHVETGQGVPAVVDVVERLGDRTLVYSQAARRLRRSSTRTRATARSAWAIPSRSAFRRQFVHLFDAAGKAYQSPALDGGRQ